MATANMVHTLTTRPSRLIFIARIVQIITGTVTMSLTITLMAFCSYYSYWYSSVQFMLLPIVVLSYMMTMIGSIGMFSHKRPNDLHWHLMLTLDWLNLVGSIPTVVLCGLWYAMFWVISIPMIVSACLSVAACLVPVIRTHRQKKRGVLPPPSDPKEKLYDVNDVPRPNDDFYCSFSSKPPSQVRRPSQAASQAGTTARWSGTSGDETEVPSYCSRTSPPASVTPSKQSR